MCTTLRTLDSNGRALHISLESAGPIIRYHDIADELRERHTGWQDVCAGIERFVIGLAKKLLLADTFAYIADHIFGVQGSIGGVSNTDLTASVAWVAALAYSFQIYFDFSGYSDMAIGLGRMFGFHILENFNYPYISRSITDFWRRWHMSLSRWFRDYLYIPLGGNRCGNLKNYRNLIVVFLLCGAWHGANWTFLVWGLWHGTFLVLERVGLGAWLSRGGRVVQHLYTCVVIVVGWVVFRADTLSQASTFLKAMAGFAANGAALSAAWWLRPSLWWSVVFAIAAATPFGRNLSQLLVRKVAQSKAHVWADAARFVGLALLLSYSVAKLAGQVYSPFIYYRF